MELVDVFSKHSTEAYGKFINYGGRIADGITLVSVAASAIDMQDGSSAAVVQPTGSVSGYVAIYYIEGGVDGHDYLITITSTPSAGGPYVDQVKMSVVDRAS